ncbi:ArsR family transcriptional regulator, partial [Streptomyces sp. SID625]|nr:ArsR family transcriptional regulator [Streptomyces sp. SID625]
MLRTPAGRATRLLVLEWLKAPAEHGATARSVAA